MAEFASKGVAGSALGLGIAGLSVALLQNQNGGNILGGLLGNGNNAMEEMRAENTLLKAQIYTDNADKGIASEVCNLKAEVAVLRKEAELQGQITDGKIARVADAATCGINTLKCSLDCLQQTVAGITRTYVHAASVTPLPAPWPFPPVPPYGPAVPFPPFVPPVVPPASSTTTTTSTTTESAGA